MQEEPRGHYLLIPLTLERECEAFMKLKIFQKWTRHRERQAWLRLQSNSGKHGLDHRTETLALLNQVADGCLNPKVTSCSRPAVLQNMQTNTRSTGKKRMAPSV